MGIIQKIRDWMVRSQKTVGHRSLYDDQRIPDCESYYDDYIEKWKLVYGVDKKAKGWLATTRKTVEAPGGSQRTRDSIGVAKILCEEVSQLIFNEEAEIMVSTEGLPEPPEGSEKVVEDPTNEYLHGVLDDNLFWIKMPQFLEHTLALGGGAIKLVHDGERLELNYLMADQFIPIGWNNLEITEGVFISQEKEGRMIYTLMEWHLRRRDEAGKFKRIIEYTLFESQNAEDLGKEIPVKNRYPNIEPSITLTEDIRTFVYFMPNIANNADFVLPLGMSIFANAVDTIKQIDMTFDSLGREFVLGKKRVIVPAAAIRNITSVFAPEPTRFFDTDDEAYEAFDVDDRENLQIQDNTVTLRVDEHVLAINTLLNILCLQTGLTAGALSFDMSSGVKTATEIISANSKTYKTIRSHQNLLRESMLQLIEAIIDYGRLYKVVPADVQYEVSINFDDGIVTDTNAEIDNAIKLTAAGLKSKKRAMMDLFGWTDIEAVKELSAIMQEITGQHDLVYDIEEPETE